MNHAKSLPGVHLLDMHPIFLDDWKKNYKKFNYEYDYHWNEWGHSVAAKALNAKIVKILEGEKP